MMVNCETGRWASGQLDLYLGEIRGDGLLSAAEERALAEAIARGDEAARSRLIRANLRLVVRIARDFVGRGLAMDDLVGEGNLGLIRAAEEFDPSFGARFSTYAGYWIKQAIRHALIATTPTIRLPSHLVNLMNKWRRAERALRRELGRAPSHEEVADAMGLTASQRQMVGRAMAARRLRHEDGGDDEGAPGTEEVADPAEAPGAALEAADEGLGLARRLERLDDRERAVVSLRYGLGGGEPLTLKEIGRRLGVTREWVRKIELGAIQKLDDDRAPETPAPPRRRRRRETVALRALQSA